MIGATGGSLQARPAKVSRELKEAIADDKLRAVRLTHPPHHPNLLVSCLLVVWASKFTQPDHTVFSAAS
jgi:hypothetical protein